MLYAGPSIAVRSKDYGKRGEAVDLVMEVMDLGLL